ncbi:MAG: sodium-dependent bicarbonate transport family permease [Flavobacteriales bacterium]
MNLDLILQNLTNPALLFFVLGLIAVQLKSDLAIPEGSSKFISLYLLFAIGFKGGQELAHSELGIDTLVILLFGVFLAVAVPFYTFFILRKKLGVHNAAAICAAYGSVSAVTFVTAVSFLESLQISFGGHMVAVMALMEAPAIIVGVLMLKLFKKNNKEDQNESKMSLGSIVKHSFTNGSVLLIVGSLIIGFLASEKHAAGIAPFTTDLFKGFLAVFLLDMGITSGKKLSAFWKNGLFPLVFSILIPFINGCVVAFFSPYITESIGDQLLFSILAASASYIAVPAAMKLAIPKANSGLYVPMALAITFPFNITIGMPIYLYIIQYFA